MDGMRNEAHQGALSRLYLSQAPSRVGLAHEETVWITIHATSETNWITVKLEAELIEPELIGPKARSYVLGQQR